MGFYRGPNIVTDGLELVVDIASERSYPGSGTTATCLIFGKTFVPDVNTPTFVTTGIAHVDMEKDNPDNLKSTSGYTGINMQNAYTRIGWFNIESSDGNFKPIIGNVVGNNINMGLCVESSRLHFHQYSNSASGGTSSGDYGISGTAQIPANTWAQGAIVVNRSAQTLKFYINGVLDKSSSIPVIGNSSSDYVLIGGPDSDSYSGARYFDGKIARVSHYNRELTAAEIAQNYNALKSRFGL
jgi:hypothetical protein